MKTEYQKSLESWARGLSDETLSEYLSTEHMNGKNLSNEEFDALSLEEVRRAITGSSNTSSG